MGLFDKLIASDTSVDYRDKVSLISPLSGKVDLLKRVPCPLFSQSIFGEGVAIEPAGFQLLAPCTGQVMAFGERGHQLRLLAKNGLQILVQLGIGSEHMLGDGFKRLVKPGQKFVQGEVLLEFDLNKMKKHLISTLCPVTIINSKKIIGIQPHCHHVIAGQDPAMTIYI